MAGTYPKVAKHNQIGTHIDRVAFPKYLLDAQLLDHQHLCLPNATMPRGGTSSTAIGASNGSSSSAKAKSEKIKEENKKKGKQRAYVEDEEEEEDEQQEPNVNDNHGDDDEEEPDAQGETDEDDEEGGGSPKGVKRSRVNEDGDSRPADKGKYKERVKTLPRDVDG